MSGCQPPPLEDCMKHLPLFNPKFSGSKGPLLADCTWFAGPEVEWVEVPAGPEAIFGNATHRVAELAIEARLRRMFPGRVIDAEFDESATYTVDGYEYDEDQPALSVADIADEYELDDDQAERLQKISGPLIDFIEANAQPTWRVEVPFRWDPFADTARQLPKTSHRNYSDRIENEIPMTLDLFAVISPTRALVLDFKSGWAWVEPPERNRQLLSQACAVATAHDLEEVLLVVLRLENERVVAVEALVDALAMEEHRAWMAARLIGSGHAEAKPGNHCTRRYCPAKPSCPATMAAVGEALAVLDVPEAKLAEAKGYKFGVVTSPEHAAWMVRALDVVGLGISVATKSLRAYADASGGIPLDGEMTWKRVEGKVVKADLNHPKATAILAEHGALGAIEKTESLSWTDVESLLGKAEMKAVREALEAAGAVTIGKRAEYKAVRGGREAPSPQALAAVIPSSTATGPDPADRGHGVWTEPPAPVPAAPKKAKKAPATPEESTAALVGILAEMNAACAAIDQKALDKINERVGKLYIAKRLSAEDRATANRTWRALRLEAERG